MKNLHVKLQEKEHVILSKFATSKGINKSDVIRHLITLLEKNIDESVNGFQDKQYFKVKRLHLSFTNEEMAQLEKNALLHGFSRTQYVYSVMRQELFGKSLIPDVELNEIREHNCLLRQIGTNLNQIAKKINTDFRHQEDIRAEEIKKTYNFIREETKFINEKIDSAISRHNKD